MWKAGSTMVLGEIIPLTRKLACFIVENMLREEEVKGPFRHGEQVRA